MFNDSDYIVIGGGASGCAVTSSLLKKNSKVTLLEAGHSHHNFLLNVPAGFFKLLNDTKYAKYYYMPGWSQQSGIIDLIINKQIWEELDLASQSAIESICLASNLEMLSFGEANQFQALKNKIIRGVKVKKFGSKLLHSLREAWESVAREKSKSN